MENFDKTKVRESLIYRAYRQIREYVDIKFEAMRWSEHDQKMAGFYRQFIKPGMMCFDVGANVGNRVKVFLRLGGLVTAVEPQDSCARVLKTAYGSNSRFFLAQKALGPAEGHAELIKGSSHALSSLSQDWIRKVQTSQRFGQRTWSQKESVEVTTLDLLIAQYGRPGFIKIDVEGYEFEVIKGLSQPVAGVSIEFIPEFIDPVVNSIKHLTAFGPIVLNYSLGESMKFELQKWVGPEDMISILSSLPDDSVLFGDVYIRSVSDLSEKSGVSRADNKKADF